MRKLGVTDRAALAELGAELRRAARAPTAPAAQLTSLIGRESETSELLALVDAHHLVTLIGPAGVGKTQCHLA
jgi:flagellar biosynthesis GTPase FlhF